MFFRSRAKMPPRCPQDAPRRPQDASKMPQEAPKTPQGSENGAKMEASWHPNRSKWKVHCGNRKISQTTLSLQWGLDFRGFEVSFSEVKSMVFRRFSVKIPQDAPRSSQDAPKCPQDVPRRPQEAPKTPQDGPGAPQDAPKTRPRASQERKKLGQIWDRKAISSGPPSKARFLSVLGWILGGFWGGLGELLRSIFHGFYV